MTEKLTIEFLVTRGEFSSAQEFSSFIEKTAAAKKIGCLETLMDYCENKNIEPHSLAKSLTSSVKQKIQEEARKLNLVHK